MWNDTDEMKRSNPTLINPDDCGEWTPGDYYPKHCYALWFEDSYFPFVGLVFADSYEEAVEKFLEHPSSSHYAVEWNDPDYAHESKDPERWGENLFYADGGKAFDIEVLNGREIY